MEASLAVPFVVKMCFFYTEVGHMYYNSHKICTQFCCTLFCCFHIMSALWVLFRHHYSDITMGGMASNLIWKHQPHDCLLNHLLRRRSKKTSKLLVTGLCAGNSPVTSEFPAQRASNAENVSIWWRHHVISWVPCGFLWSVSSYSPVLFHWHITWPWCEWSNPEESYLSMS